ncbi:endocytosis defective- protein [Rhizoclosmatium sp. JEL0117]|nr:endocytosis defective- protein [Rhizoclosmatium hyalinum]KAJ3298998.1 endocytosis defective- protein [Rhizoclosmatium sp. JEL0117]
MAQSFDWYISPTDRFTYEEKFPNFCNDEDEVQMSSLEPLYQTSHLSQSEFAQIWTLVSLGNTSINKEQFIYFQHVLTSRRKGKPLPIGVPMHIKEGFLKSKAESKLYTRYVPGTRDIAASAWKDAAQLQEEIIVVEKDIVSFEETRVEAEAKLADLTQTSDEMNGLAGYKKNHLSSVRDDVTMLRDSLKLLNADGAKQKSTAGSGVDAGITSEVNDIITQLMAEKAKLEAKKRALQSQA